MKRLVNGTLVQLQGDRSAPADLSVRQTAQLLGLEVVGATHAQQALAEIRRRIDRQCKVAFATSASLSGSLVSQGDPTEGQILNEIGALCDSFIHSFPVLERGSEPFKENCPSTVSPRAGRHESRLGTYKFTRAVADSPLSGLGFQTECAEAPVLFDLESVKDAMPLVTVNDLPLLICFESQGRHQYLLSERPSINLEAALTPPQVASDFYAEILPVAVALRTMFGSACWHSPFPTGCVIVDDPLLRKEYGFFKYSEIVQELTTHQYSLTLAFVPINFRRSDPDLASSLSRHSDCFSICVHGCDHTSAEFGDTDPDSVENKAATALVNMYRHKALTGLPFDRVMIFPQGLFSSYSPPALKKCRYLAAVNSTPYPTNYFAAPTTIADLFTIAITRHASFPIFTRHYPRQLFDFAVDLFWGKPVFVGEHHNYFRQGAKRLSDFVQALKELNPKVRWLTLENAIIRSGQYKSIAEHSYSVRFVTSKFVLTNPLTTRCVFLCSKPETRPSDVRRVTVDGHLWSHTIGDDHISLQLTLEGSEERTIVIEYQPVKLKTFDMPMAYRFNVFVRRRLSEFRDNYIAKHEGLLKLAIWLKNRLFGRNEPPNFSRKP